MLKKIGIVVTIMFAFLFVNDKANAATGYLTVKTSSNFVVVGNNVNVYVTLSSAAPLGSWDFTINYDSSKLRLISANTESGGNRAVSYSNGSEYSRTYTYTFRAIASGWATVWINDALVYGFDTNPMTMVNGSVGMTLKTQQEIIDSYSKNNYLSSLTVDGYTLSPEFNRSVTEYTVTLDSNVEKINVSGTLEDNTASVEGFGEKQLTDGENIININVTSQSGNLLTYVIKANVKELNPIVLKIDGDDYTVVKKKSALTAPTNYLETTVKINNEEVPAFSSDITKYTLIGVKDSDGNIKYCVYKDNTCTLYKEFNFSNSRLYPIEAKEIPEGYTKNTININDEVLTAYVKDNYYPLIYAKNLDTGFEHFYTYDKTENSVQIFKEVKIENHEFEYFIGMCILGGVSLILLTILIIVIIVKRKKENYSLE